MLTLPAIWMRAGTSKGLFITRDDLPIALMQDSPDAPMRSPNLQRALLRALGSPDPYGKQMDGLGGASSSTSKVVIVGKSSRSGCDVDYLFGQVSVDHDLIDWSGNCGNLSGGVGPFAIHTGLVPPAQTRGECITTVRIWQANVSQLIIAHVPCKDGVPVEVGDFLEDGVASYPGLDGQPTAGCAIDLELHDPALMNVLPTGYVQQMLPWRGNRSEGHAQDGVIAATCIIAGNPTVFIRAKDVGLTGRELPGQFNQRLQAQPDFASMLESIRAHGAVAMGLSPNVADATAKRPATPKLAFVAQPEDYTASSGVRVPAEQTDITARILSMGQLHHAFTGTGAIALAVAAQIPGTIVNECIMGRASMGRSRAAREFINPPEVVHGVNVAPNTALSDDSISHEHHSKHSAWTRIGHVSGVLSVGAHVVRLDDGWAMQTALMQRSARRLMVGKVFIPL